MAGSERLDPKVLKTAGVLIFGILAVVFDTTIVGVALHSLAADLHTTVATVQWVTTAYLLALGMTVPLGAAAVVPPAAAPPVIAAFSAAHLDAAT